jgi:hypothetical protein
MSHQFKPGDLALTLASRFGIPAMCQVELVVYLMKGQKAEEPDGQLWTAPHDGWIVGRENEIGYGFFAPQQLMPLRGDFTPEQQKSQEVAA